MNENGFLGAYCWEKFRLLSKNFLKVNSYFSFFMDLLSDSKVKIQFVNLKKINFTRICLETIFCNLYFVHNSVGNHAEFYKIFALTYTCFQISMDKS